MWPYVGTSNSIDNFGCWIGLKIIIYRQQLRIAKIVPSKFWSESRDVQVLRDYKRTFFFCVKKSTSHSTAFTVKHVTMSLFGEHIPILQ